MMEPAPDDHPDLYNEVAISGHLVIVRWMLQPNGQRIFRGCDEACEL